MEDVYEHEVQVRYRDLDTYGHVNNVVYGTYCEEARIAWLEAAFDIDLDEFSAVIASMELEFHRSVRGRATLTVAVSVEAVGRSSFTLDYRIRKGDRLMAEGESTQVYVDPETREAQPLPDRCRDPLEGALGTD